ncbi:hypothetical protein HDU92_005650, partial [Lobulomyces angularis]
KQIYKRKPITIMSKRVQFLVPESASSSNGSLDDISTTASVNYYETYSSAEYDRSKIITEKLSKKELEEFKLIKKELVDLSRPNKLFFCLDLGF